MALFQPPPTWASPVNIEPEEPKPGEAPKKRPEATFNPVWLKWFVDLVSILNNSGGGGGTIQHNSLAGLQGGQANQLYHLTLAEYTFLQAINTGTTSAKIIAAATYVNALTATTGQVNQLASGLSITITTAKLTGGGANGSMTFTNGVLTAQTAAT